MSTANETTEKALSCRSVKNSKMGLSDVVTQPMVDRLIGWLFPPSPPLRSGFFGGLSFSPFMGGFTANFRNTTARTIHVDSFVLLASGPRRSFYQPLELKVLQWDSEGINEAWGLRDGNVRPYAHVMIGLGAEHVLDRVMKAKSLEIVAISEGTPVWRQKTGTAWLRRAVREAAQMDQARGAHLETKSVHPEEPPK